MRYFRKLRRQIDKLEKAQIDRIYRAYEFALQAHKGQKRLSGEPYISHPVEVACILSKMCADTEAIIAALLHDVIEDTPVTKAMVVEAFGHTIAELVDGVSKLTQIEYISRAEQQAENFRKMLLAMSKDLRVILVKLADRLHNMRTTAALSAEKRRRVAKETLDIFAPVAKRLGMRACSVELEELSFMALYPERYAALKDAVKKERGNRKKVLNYIERSCRIALEKSNLQNFTLIGREKHLFSLYRKMRDKGLGFSEVMDLYAMRIIVQNVSECYQVLGIMHQLYKPVIERFKDYIAIPKANGYQSLHTTLFGPYGLPVEIQIRTECMHKLAESGIAAHWLYKSEEKAPSVSQCNAQVWVENLLDLQASLPNSLEFLENVKINLFPDEVYVFTPRGEIMALPAGATALDFAYAVHTALGNACVAVRIDRKPAALSSVLLSGQTIEVVNATNATPKAGWLDFVVTSKARNSIRNFIKAQSYTVAIKLGRQLLESALSTLGLSLKKISKSRLSSLLSEVQCNTMEELFADIGLARRIPLLIAQKIMRQSTGEACVQQSTTAYSLDIRGTEGAVVKYAHCCAPIPGDAIVGTLEADAGIIIHTEGCLKLRKLRRYPEKILSLEWSDQVSREFIVGVSLSVLNRRGLLAVVAKTIAEIDSNIEDMEIVDREEGQYRIIFRFSVRNQDHFSEIMAQLRQIEGIMVAKRVA